MRETSRDILLGNQVVAQFLSTIVILIIICRGKIIFCMPVSNVISSAYVASGFVFISIA